MFALSGLFDLAARYVGPVAADAMRILLVTSVLAGVLSFHNVITRYQFTLGNAGVLPDGLGRSANGRGERHRMVRLPRSGDCIHFGVSSC